MLAVRAVCRAGMPAAAQAVMPSLASSESVRHYSRKFGQRDRPRPFHKEKRRAKSEAYPVMAVKKWLAVALGAIGAASTWFCRTCLLQRRTTQADDAYRELLVLLQWSPTRTTSTTCAKTRRSKTATILA
jgi:hypothetical protein